MARPKRPKRKESFAAGVGRGLRRAARTARKIAQMYGTPIFIWENGKVVAIDPYTEKKLKSNRLKNIKRTKT